IVHPARPHAARTVEPAVARVMAAKTNPSRLASAEGQVGVIDLERGSFHVHWISISLGIPKWIASGLRVADGSHVVRIDNGIQVGHLPAEKVTLNKRGKISRAAIIHEAIPAPRSFAQAVVTELRQEQG